METETIDRLFLELSQFSKAKTRRELVLEKALREIADGRWGTLPDAADIDQLYKSKALNALEDAGL